MDASVPSAVGDAPMRSKRVANDSTFRGALVARRFLSNPNHGRRRCRYYRGNRIDASQRGEYKFSFNLAFLFCAVVIKWPDEDISGYEQISRTTNPSLTPVRRIPGAFAGWMRWHLLR